MRTNGPGKPHIYEALRYFLERAAMTTGSDGERYYSFGQAARPPARPPAAGSAGPVAGGEQLGRGGGGF